jgi:DNA-binding MarR family transcriptional regulator
MSRAPRLFHLLSLAQRRAQSVAEAGLIDLDVSAAQVGVLFVIPESGAASLGEIAALLGLAQSGASTLAQRMERAGLIMRAPDQEDARITRVELTARGRATRAEAVRRVQTLNRRFASGFSSDEVGVVARWLAHVAALEVKP